MDKRTAPTFAVTIAVLLAATACSSDGEEDPGVMPASAGSSSGAGSTGLAYSPHSVGFGEALNTAGGAHRVLSMDTDATSAAVDAGEGNRVVSALVEECASPRGPITASSQGWSVITQPAADEPVTSPVELQPTSEGAPSVDDAREIDADSCAMGDLVFVVPDDATVLGFHYEHEGSRTATWIKTPG